MSAVDVLSMTSHQHPPFDSQQFHSQSPPKSPAAPSYSPITPKASIVLPVASDAAFVRPPDNDHDDFPLSHKLPGHGHVSEQDKLDPTMKTHPAHYIPQPPNLPFSSEDSSDAIALRAAISTLQHQRQKAQSDLKTLESLKKLALDDPKQFTEELKAGRLMEVKPKLSSLRPFVEGEEDSEDDDDVDDEKPAMLGAQREDEEGALKEEKEKQKSLSPPPRTEIPDSQASRPASKEGIKFPKIPGPQDIVRTPYINWAKYGVVGAPLDSMHAQQQKWPGSTNFTNDRGREHTIAAPYSPFHDELEEQPRREGQEDTRRDSGPQPSLTGTISEHVMSTRSRN